MRAGMPSRDWVWALAVVLLTVCLVIWDALDTLSVRRHDAAERLQALARVVEARTYQIFLGIDRMLAEAGSDLERATAPGDPEYGRLLKARAKVQAEALTITIVALDGTILHSTAPNLVGKNVGDRSYLRHFRDNPDDRDLFIGEPVKGLLNRTIVFAARAIEDPKGELAGVAVSAVSPAVFSGLLDAAMPTEFSGAISLSNRDHLILARVPDLDGDAIGVSLAKAPLLVAHVETGQQASIQEGAGGVDQVRRMVAVRTVKPWGLTIGVSVAVSDILRPALPRLAGDGLLVLAVMAATIALVRLIRQRERARALAHDDLLRARDYYMSVLEDLPALIRRSGQDGRCDAVNRTWSAFTGRPVVAELGDGWLEGVHPEDRVVAASREEGTYRLRGADGVFRWVQQTTRPLTGPDGEPAGSLSACVDVTDVRKVQEQLLRSNQELEQFAYVASHDLREPLRMISSYLTLIERRLADGQGDLKEFLGYAKDGALRMDRLVTDLLQLSRIGRMSGSRQMVSAQDAAQRALRLLAVTVEESGAKVDIGTLPDVYASDDDLTRLFQNLIGNAIKYASPGTVPEVRVSAEREEYAWRFVVSDNGIGIEADHFERVFGIFQRLHGRDEYQGGSGIGLAICKKIVEGMGGRIWVESDGAGQGCRFVFTLPADPGSAVTTD